MSDDCANVIRSKLERAYLMLGKVKKQIQDFDEDAWSSLSQDVEEIGGLVMDVLVDIELEVGK